MLKVDKLGFAKTEILLHLKYCHRQSKKNKLVDKFTIGIIGE